MPLKDRADVRLAIHIGLRGGAGDENSSKEKNRCEFDRHEHYQALVSSVRPFRRGCHDESRCRVCFT
jgi:hypothetical protein